MIYSHLCNQISPNVGTFFDYDPVRISQFFKVSVPTARRWLKYNRLPGPAKQLLAVVSCGFLPASDGWEGFRIYDNRLVSPAGHDVTPPQLLAALYAAELPQNRNIERWLHIRQGAVKSPSFLELVKR